MKKNIKTILFITAFPPNQKTAGQDYTLRLIIDLVKKGYSVSIIYTEYVGHDIEIPDSVKILDVIHPSLKNCIKKPIFHPFFTKRYDRNVLNRIKAIANNYDMLYFDFSQMHIYSKYINHPNKVLMCHDVIAQKYMRKGILQLPWILVTEKTLLKTASLIVTFSKKDCNFIKKFYRLESISVNFYLKNDRFKYENLKLSNNLFCFYGAWNRMENVECLIWFIKYVYPKLKADLQFIIIGGGLSESLKLKLSEYNNMTYYGYVDNPLIEISKCQALIAPLHKGAGVKVKVIDALSTGTCVIGSNVAFEGIVDNQENSLFFHAESPETYASLLNNWNMISYQRKQISANEFFERYNTNHFTDYCMNSSKVLNRE